jgi:hypothetical protein
VCGNTSLLDVRVGESVTVVSDATLPPSSDGGVTVELEPLACNVQCIGSTCYIVDGTSIIASLSILFGCSDGQLRLTQSAIEAISRMPSSAELKCNITMPIKGTPLTPGRPSTNTTLPPGAPTPPPAADPDVIGVVVTVRLHVAAVAVQHVWLPPRMPRAIPQPLLLVAYHPAAGNAAVDVSTLSVMYASECAVGGRATVFLISAGTDALPVPTETLAPGRCFTFNASLGNASFFLPTASFVTLPPLTPQQASQSAPTIDTPFGDKANTDTATGLSFAASWLSASWLDALAPSPAFARAMLAVALAAASASVLAASRILRPRRVLHSITH